jgi:hypothetical protein
MRKIFPRACIPPVFVGLCPSPVYAHGQGGEALGSAQDEGVSQAQPRYCREGQCRPRRSYAMQTAMAVCAIVALSLGAAISTAHASGGAAAGGGSGGRDIKQVRAECAASARAKFCGGAGVHCAKGSPAQKQALADIDACMLSRGGKL